MSSAELLLLLALSAAAGPAPAPLIVGVLETPGTCGAGLYAGAEAAAREVNSSGGIAGRPLVLRRLADSNPWKTGARLMAQLTSAPGLLALLGPQDGAGAHLAAQVATRRRIPVIVLSPEDSLTQAKDPWVFRGVPSDRRQAEALLLWAAADPRGKTAAAVVPEGREGRERLRSLRAACRSLGVNVSEDSPPRGADFLLLWLDPGPALRWFQGAGSSLKEVRLLGSLRLDDEVFLRRAPPQAEGLALPRLGGLTAAAHDLVLAIADAARREGPGTAEVRRGLASGSPRFDSRGNREGPVPVGALRRRSPSGFALEPVRR